MARSVVESGPTAVVQAGLVERAGRYILESSAPATIRGRRSDWRAFAAWCAGHDLPALPASPDAVALYVTSMAERGSRPATIARHLSSIASVHAGAGHASPTRAEVVRRCVRGIRRSLGVAPRPKDPLTTLEVRRMVGALPDRLLGVRDRAMLLVGFAGGFRRSELAGLEVGDVVFTDDGLRITLRRSKTDQEGAGHLRGVPWGSHPSTCPVRALRAWIDAAGLKSGPLFRRMGKADQVLGPGLTGQSVALVVKRSAKAAGLDPSRVSGHSLRSGMATSAAQAGAPAHAIRRQGGWRSSAMLARYIRPTELFESNAAAFLGL
jgi:integrase